MASQTLTCNWKAIRWMFTVNEKKKKRASTWANVPSDMCAQRRLESACSSAQSDQSSLSAWRNFHPWLSTIHPVKIVIRLCECAGWSESSLDAHVRRYVFPLCGSYPATCIRNSLLLTLIINLLHHVDSSTTTLWTGLFSLTGCLVSFYYVIQKFL